MLLNKEECADALRCSPSKVNRLLADGSLAFVRIRRRALTQRTGFDQFVQRCARKTVREFARPA